MPSSGDKLKGIPSLKEVNGLGDALVRDFTILNKPVPSESNISTGFRLEFKGKYELQMLFHPSLGKV